MLSGLFTSVIHRPYVFAFLAAYLFLAWRRWGWPRTLLWLLSGYAIAWLSEVSSITNGFPYGEYHYVYENLKGELLIAGVPFFDSLSYVFLTFAGFTMAEWMLLNLELRASRRRTPDARLETRDKQKIPRCRFCFSVSRLVSRVSSLIAGVSSLESRVSSLILLGALLTMLLDVIIDPIATIGDRWFLGQIHWYAHPGWYFGVPLTNFGGWFLVSLAIIGFNVLAWHLMPDVKRAFRTKRHAGTLVRWYARTKPRDCSCTRVPEHQSTRVPNESRVSCLMYPAFYAGIALFSIAISFWVGEWKLGLASTVILATIGGIILFRGTRQRA